MNGLEKLAREMGGYDKMPESKLKYLRQIMPQDSMSTIEGNYKAQEAEIRKANEKELIKSMVLAVMKFQKVGVGSCEFASILREIANEIDD